MTKNGILKCQNWHLCSRLQADDMTYEGCKPVLFRGIDKTQLHFVSFQILSPDHKTLPLTLRSQQARLIRFRVSIALDSQGLIGSYDATLPKACT